MTDQAQEIPPEVPGKKHRWLKVALSLSVLLLVIAIIVVGSALFAINTQWGRGQLAAMVSKSDAIAIDQIEGNLYGGFVIRGLSLTDPEGTWLTIPEAVVSWSPLALLKRTADITDIQVPQINVLRAPIAGDEDEVSEPFNITNITSQPVSVRLRNLEAKSISWLGALEGEERVTLAATGSLERNTSLEFALALVPLTPGIADEINADIVLNTKDTFAQTKVTMDASADGLLATLMGLPGATDARLEGQGTPGEWSGLIKADVDTVSVADITAQYKTPEGAASGSLFLKPFLTAPSDTGDTDLFDAPMALEAAFQRVSDNRFAFETTITSPAIKSHVDGRLSYVDQRFAAEDVRLNTTLNGRVGGIALDAVDTQLLLNGDFSDVTAQVAVKANTITSGAATVSGINADALISQSPSSTKAELSGALGAVSGIGGIDPRILQDIQFNGQAATSDDASTVFTATAKASNGYFNVSATDVRQNAAGAVSAAFKGAVADLTAFPGAIDAAGTLEGTASQASNGATNIKLSSAIRPNKGTAHWIGRVAQDALLINATTRLYEDNITVSNLALKSDRTDLKGNASLTGDTIDANVLGKIESKAFNDLAPGASEDPATFDISAKGPLATVMPRGNISLPGFNTGGVIFRDIALQLTAPDGAIDGRTALQLSGRSSAGPVRGTAIIERFADGLITIQEADARIANIIGTADLQLGGDTSGPQGTLSVGVTPISYAQAGLFGLSGNVNIDATLSSGEDAKLNFEGSGPRLAYGPNNDPSAEMRNIALSGTVDLSSETANVTADISAKAVEAAGLFLDSIVINARQEGDIQRAQITAVQNSARLTNAVLDVTIAPQNEATLIQIDPSGVLAGAPLDSNEPIAISLNAQQVQLAPVTITVGGGVLALSAEQSQARLASEFTLQGFQLRTITDLLQQPAYYGVVNAEAGFEATPSTGKLKAAYSVSGLATKSNSALAIALEGSLSAGPNALETQLTASHNQEAEELIAVVSMPISWPDVPSMFVFEENEALEGSVTLDTRLAPWWQLADIVDQELTGKLTGDIQLGGTLANIDPSGALQLRDTRYENLEYGTQIEELFADIVLSQERVTLQSLTANDGRGGTLDAQAAARLFPFSPEDSQIAFKDFQFVAKDGLAARADADLKLVTTDKRLGLKGDISIAEARYAISATGVASVPTLPIEEINKGSLHGFDDDAQVVDAQISEAEGAKATTLDLDLSVLASRRIFVTGMGLSSEWSTQLDIAGTSQVPLVEGEIKLVRGELEFAGKRFALERGQIYLDGDVEIDPRLDILAQNNQGDFTANIGITGTASDPEITLSSTPALPDDEILSRILFGTSATDLSALEAVQLGSALAALSSGGGTSALDVAGKARSATGLDRLSLGSNDSSTAITGGKYLSPDVFLQFTTDPGTGQYLAALEWYVTRTLSLLSEYGANTGSNVAARWSRTY